MLWSEYKNGNFKDQKTLKCRVRLDHVRINLYHQSVPRSSVCVDMPSIEYWRELHKEGRLKPLFEGLKACGFDDISGVVPVTDELIAFYSEVLNG
jgi:hypothetical protein